MTQRYRRNSGLSKGLRWSARIVGGLAAALFTLFIVESGARVLPALSWNDLQGMPVFAALVVGVAGVLIAWRREATGGLLAVTGGVAIMTLVYLASGAPMMLAAFLLTLPLLVSGALYLACFLRVRVTMTVRKPRLQRARNESKLAVA